MNAELDNKCRLTFTCKDKHCRYFKPANPTHPNKCYFRIKGLCTSAVAQVNMCHLFISYLTSGEKNQQLKKEVMD